MHRPPTVTVAGIPTVRATRAELAALMVRDHHLASAGLLLEPRIASSSNGNVIAMFHTDAAFRAALLQADIVDADGMPLVMASRFLCKGPLRERTATTDFVHDAADAAIAAGMRFYFLGGRPGVAAEAATQLQARHPGLQIAGVRDGYFGRADEPAICDAVLQARTDVLWVGLGSPAQELFAVRNRARLRGLTWIRTCGGLFDHKAGRVPRAPAWMQSAGLEWLHRMLREPRRLGLRYLKTNPVAAYHLLTKTHD